MDCVENLLCGLLARERHSALVLAHLAFVHARILCETAGIDEVEVLEEGREVIAELHPVLRNFPAIRPGILRGFIYACKEVFLRDRDRFPEASEVVLSEMLLRAH